MSKLVYIIINTNESYGRWNVNTRRSEWIKWFFFFNSIWNFLKWIIFFSFWNWTNRICVKSFKEVVIHVHDFWKEDNFFFKKKVISS